MIGETLQILRDNWLLLLIGQYPNGPLGGIAATLILSALSIGLAFPLSVLIALARLSRNPLLLWPSTALVYLTRGVPLLMLILWVYFMVPILIGTTVPGFVAMLVALVLYDGAFLSEVVRGGIVALGRGQMEAARALGQSYPQALLHVILPQALYNVIPSLITHFVSTIKETTLGYVINVPELTFAANQINNQILTQPFQVFFLLAIIYYAVCWTLTFLAVWIEQRIARRRASPAAAPATLSVRQLTAEP